MNKANRKKYSKYLKWGDKAQLAKKANVHPKTVSSWLDGDFESCSCEGLIIDLLLLRKKQSDKILEEFK